jgi:hypothetical protein
VEVVQVAVAPEDNKLWDSTLCMEVFVGSKVEGVRLHMYMFSYCEVMIIAVAELMHIFIHFYIGHLEEEHGDNNYSKFRNLILAEFVLTLGLAGVIWLEGEVSS